MPEFFPAFRAERNKKPILFKNAKIYDGSDMLSGPKDVLVVGNLIQDIEQSISGENSGAVTIDCSGLSLIHI
jgi:dihydroorotase-like cyclic amidohydrolase